MFKNIILALFALTLVSCHKKLAFFQPSKSINYHSEKIPSISQSIPETDNYISPDQTEFTASLEGNLEFKENHTIEIVDSKTEIIKLKKPEIEKTLISEFYVTKKINTDKLVEKSTLKRKKIYPLFNDNLKIGLVFLGIAAILALFSLNQLVLIFGLASLVFLYLGLKKYYRRKRIKSIFKK